jgi:hypothetical protein
MLSTLLDFKPRTVKSKLRFSLIGSLFLALTADLKHYSDLGELRNDVFTVITKFSVYIVIN